MPYTGTPGGSLADAIRLEVGDTGGTVAADLLTDAEYVYLIAKGGAGATAAQLAPQAARWIAAKFARDADRSEGDVSEQLSQRSAHFEKLARWLQSVLVGGAGAAPVPTWGGADIGPFFYEDMHSASGADDDARRRGS